MKSLAIIKINPKNINEKQWEEIYQLHQDFFNLDKKCIKENLLKRDLVILYYESTTNHLIATGGLQWIESEKFALLYLGNIVVACDKRHAAIFSHLMMHGMKQTVKKYKNKPKYISGFTTTPQVYSFCCKFLKNGWPQFGKKIPDDLRRVVMVLLHGIQCNIHEMNDFKIITKISQKNDNKSVYITDKKEHPPKFKKNIENFHALNPSSQEGYQLLYICKINLKCLLSLHTHILLKRFKNYLKC
jgi:predicted GNAT family N-acyltransferase